MEALLVRDSIRFEGRLFKPCDEARNAVMQIQWARGVLAAPAVTYQNGRDSHEVAGEVIEQHEDELLDCEVFAA